jgi:hypothetical protein
VGLNVSGTYIPIPDRLFGRDAKSPQQLAVLADETQQIADFKFFA